MDNVRVVHVTVKPGDGQPGEALAALGEAVRAAAVQAAALAVTGRQ